MQPQADLRAPIIPRVHKTPYTRFGEVESPRWGQWLAHRYLTPLPFCIPPTWTCTQVSLSRGVPGADIVGPGTRADHVSSHHAHGQRKVRARLARLWFYRGAKHCWMVMQWTCGHCHVERPPLVLQWDTRMTSTSWFKTLLLFHGGISVEMPR